MSGIKVKVEYVDHDSFTVEEVVKRVTDTFGKHVRVELGPESSIAYDHIYFGLQQLITHRQLSLYYDSGGSYEQDLKKLKAEVLGKVNELLDQVASDNENKAS